MLGRLKRKHGLDGAERLGMRKDVSVVRLYTEEKGWSYGKLTDDASVDGFAANVKRAPASRHNLKVGK